MIKNILVILIIVIISTFWSCEKTQNRVVFSPDSMEVIDSLLRVADNYRNDDIDSMLLLSENVTQLAKQAGYQAAYFQGLFQQGLAHFYRGEDSIAYSKLELIQDENLEKEKRIEFIFAKKNSLKGSIYHNRDLYDSAAIYMFDALQTFEKQEDTHQMALVCVNIAINYLMTDNKDKAMEFTQKAAIGFQKENNQEGLATVCERMGSIYAYQEVYDSALFYFQKSLELSYEIDHTYLIANGNHNIGTVYFEQNQFEIGSVYLQKAVELFQKQHNLLGYAMTISNLGEIDWSQKKYQAALLKYQEVNEIALKNDFLALQKESNNRLSEIYEFRGDFKLALEYNQRAQIISDSINKTERSKTIQKLENQYINVQKDKIILEQQIDIQKERNRGLLTFLVAIVIMLISSFLIWKRKSENQLLAEKNDLIKNQQRELKHRTENQLEQLSDLFTIYGFMNDNKTEVLKEAQSRVEAINLIYKYLGNSQGNDIDVKPFIEKLIENIFVIYGIQKSEIDIEIDVLNIKMDANKTQIIGQIVNEVLNNTFKHAFVNELEKGKIIVKLEQTKLNFFKLVISDNGKGFNKDKTQYKDRMGLSLIAAFVKSIRGEIETETGVHGTKYQIVFS